MNKKIRVSRIVLLAAILLLAGGILWSRHLPPSLVCPLPQQTDRLSVTLDVNAGELRNITLQDAAGIGQIRELLEACTFRFAGFSGAISYADCPDGTILSLHAGELHLNLCSDGTVYRGGCRFRANGPEIGRLCALLTGYFS